MAMIIVKNDQSKINMGLLYYLCIWFSKGMFRQIQSYISGTSSAYTYSSSEDDNVDNSTMQAKEAMSVMPTYFLYIEDSHGGLIICCEQ